jgi:hypothetical protein
LNNIIFGLVGVPIRARAIDVRDIHESSHLGFALEKLQREAFGCVPCDVAVHKPSLLSSLVTWINRSKQERQECRKEIEGKELLTPGLSVYIAITKNPDAGSIATSLRGESVVVRVVEEEYVPVPEAKTQKSWPCK